MRNKGSKRQRKHAASQSLKSKQQAPAVDAWDLLLGEELQPDDDAEGAGGLADSNALILPAGKQPPSGGGTAQQQQQQPVEHPLSKSQLKKLRQVQQRKEQRAQLTQVIGRLQGSSLPQEQLALLRPLHQRGAKETKKQRLRRALKLQRAGLTGVDGVDELLQARRVKGVGPRSGSAGGDESGSGSGSGSEDGSESQDDSDGRPAKQARTAGATDAATAVAAAAAGQQQPQPDDSSEEEEGEEEPGAAAAAAAEQQSAADAAAAAKAQRQALRAQAAALKAQAKADADGGAVDEDVAEEAAVARAAAAERAAAAAAGPTRVVQLRRPPAMEEARRQLPILGLEQEIMEGVLHNDVVVLCGETGCGKTTQVPQFLLEAGFGCRDFAERAGAVCVTQPRRVAAISTAERVAAELGSPLGGLVGYQVRHDRRVGPSSAVRFLTDGVLMRQLQSDFLLSQYSVVLLDEAHERSLNTDLLLGMLSRLVPLRRRLHEQWKAAGCPPGPAAPSAGDAAGDAGDTGAAAAAAGGGPVYPLKLIIMSATLRTSDFTANSRLFARPPPVLHVPARQFPVTVHFARRTELEDYVAAAVRKVCRIHRELPGGGILLFLTGQREVQLAVRRIRQAFARSSRGNGGGAAAAQAAAAAAAGDDDGGDEAGGAAAGADAAELAADAADAALERDLLDAAAGDAAASAAADDYDSLEQDEDEEEVQVLGGEGWTPEELAAAEARFEREYGLSLRPAGGGDGNGDGEAAAGEQQQQQQQQRAAAAPVHVLPLYAMLPQAQQAAVFRPPPAGHRLIVVATNVAETSITIPGVRYVVDAGRSKQKLLESGGGGAAVARYVVGWVSKAAAEQRAGRAGRTGPGHVYRLYSSAHFNDSFDQHTAPEIANTPLEGVVLLIKAMGVDKVHNFPFPSPPEPEALRAATRCLLALGALSPEQQQRRAGAAAAPAAGRLTALGRAMAVFPVTPRHSRMLLQLAVWQQRQRAGPLGGGVSAAGAAAALPYAVALAAALSLESPFMHVDALQSELESSAADAAQDAGQEAEDGGGGGGGGGEDEAPEGKHTKAANRRRVQAASAAHARFRSTFGDALSSLNALCAYEGAAAAGQAEEFCSANFLHARHLREMGQLRQQLGRALLQLQAQPGGKGGGGGGGASGPAHLPGGLLLQSGGEQGDAAAALLSQLSGAVERAGPEWFGQPLPLPTASVLEVLRRALAAGWCDQVSRRVRSSEHIARMAQEGRLSRRATRYVPVCLDEEVFLHPRSCLASLAPEYVVYGDLVRTAKRPYMALVTSVEPQWLADVGSSLCEVSPPLLDPPPSYRPDADAVVAWHDAAYGPAAWPLPRVLLPHPDPAVRAGVFGAALLAGRVLPALSELAPALVAPAATAARPELAGLPRVGELLAALQSQQAFSRAALAAAWARQPDFLRPQLTAWLQKQQRHLLGGLWPQLLQQAADGGGTAAAAAAGQRKKKKRKPAE